MNNKTFELTLVQRQFIAANIKKQTWIASIIIVLLFVFLMVSTITIITHTNCNTSCYLDLINKIFYSFTLNTRKSIELIIFTLYAAVSMTYMMLASKYESIVLTKSGIRYNSPLPKTIRFLRPDWSIQWSDITSYTINRPQHTNSKLLSLSLNTLDSKKKIFIYNWVNPLCFKQEKFKLFNFSVSSLQDDTKLITNSALYQYIQTHCEQLSINPKNIDINYAGYPLEKNSWALSIVISFFVLLAYTVLDFAFIEESYINFPPYSILIGIGVISSILLFFLLRHKKVPIAESCIIGILTGITLGCSLYPGLLRFNMLSDFNGAESFTYQMQTETKFIPLNPTMPNIHITRYYGYWSSFEQGFSHEFQFHKGLLGFWQLNMTPVKKAAELYYETNKGHSR